ncbi:uncharacterized protein LOC106012180 [Aplysia californica]|uniref:Uncharacterized protein LOC106012180 n=1 Tax=Aplysia californica TaxID=6500 RepID=A0ABM1A2X1_APLCA|nr:uncharacterized protein LOC106012180 [Aplysia californica]
MSEEITRPEDFLRASSASLGNVASYASLPGSSESLRSEDTSSGTAPKLQNRSTLGAAFPSPGSLASSTVARPSHSEEKSRRTVQKVYKLLQSVKIESSFFRSASYLAVECDIDDYALPHQKELLQTAVRMCVVRSQRYPNSAELLDCIIDSGYKIERIVGDFIQLCNDHQGFQNLPYFKKLLSAQQNRPDSNKSVQELPEQSGERTGRGGALQNNTKRSGNNSAEAPDVVDNEHQPGSLINRPTEVKVQPSGPAGRASITEPQNHPRHVQELRGTVVEANPAASARGSTASGSTRGHSSSASVDSAGKPQQVRGIPDDVKRNSNDVRAESTVDAAETSRKENHAEAGNEEDSRNKGASAPTAGRETGSGNSPAGAPSSQHTPAAREGEGAREREGEGARERERARARGSLKDVVSREHGYLRGRMTCAVCTERHAETTFLPCGHFAVCSSCSTSCNNCPVCHKKVLAEVKTFLT